MEFTTSRDSIYEPLSHVIGAVERRPQIDVLGNVLLRLDGGTLDIKASDNELEMTASTRVETNYSGMTTVPARKLLDICKNLNPGTELKFRLDGERAVVRSGRSRYTLATLPAVDFPTVNIQGAEAQRLQITAGEFHGVLKMAGSAMAKQDVRFYLVGVLMDVDREKITCVGTDGHRMAKVECAMVQGPTAEFKAIIPRKAVIEMLRMLVSASSDTLVDVLVSRNNMQVSAGDMCLKTKLVDGRYPDYNRVIPTNNDKRVIVKKDILRMALTRASILSSNKYKGVEFGLTEGLLTLSGNSEDNEESLDQIDIDYSGKPLNVGFNINYMIDSLATFDDKEVCIDLKDSSSSAVITSNGCDCTCVVMPMRL